MNRPELDTSRRAKYGVAGLYVLIVLAGSYVGSQLWLGAEGVHYLASRRNILNQVFVKRGWLWFTLVFWASFIGRWSAIQQQRTTTFIQSAILRYGAATLWWVLFTQWFFGPPLMDRAFTFTGGACIIAPAADSQTIGTAVAAAVGTAVNSLGSTTASRGSSLGSIARRAIDIGAKLPKTSSRCRGSGGIWVGGHDPSGHVFLLVHSSMVLWMEILPSFLSQRHLGRRLGWEIKLPLVLLGFWAVMLFITCVYFHSTAEKISGLACGLVANLIIYIYGESASWGRWFGVGSPQAVIIEPKPVLVGSNPDSSNQTNSRSNTLLRENNTGVPLEDI